MKVILNCAMTADGKIASKERKQAVISSEEDMRRVHVLRSQVDAVLVGVGTVLADDPSLSVKEKYVPGGRSPLRVVLDPGLRTPPGSRILQDGVPTVIYSCVEGSVCGAEVVALPGPVIPLCMVLDDMEKRGLETLLVEGGGETMWRFLDQGMVDEYNVFVGSMLFGGRSAPTPVDGEGRVVSEAMRLELLSAEVLGNGVLLSYRVKKC